MLNVVLEMSQDHPAYLTELFSSVQGEGPYVGKRQIFVRFYGCHRRCVFCDSPETVTAWQPAGFKPATYQLEQTPGQRDFSNEPNPVSINQLMDQFARFDQPRGKHHSIAFTGGEPLLHADFLRELFPRLRAEGYMTYLETAGDLYHELEKVIPWLDICAMDIKLPSVTQNEAAWGSHKKFLGRCIGQGVYTFCKIIVSAETTDADIKEAVQLVAGIAPDIPFIIQPMTPFGEAQNPPTSRQLLVWQEFAQSKLDDVRIIPQCHKMMGQL
jgi:7-carboxy-7-deazaguanine synthase